MLTKILGIIIRFTNKFSHLFEFQKYQQFPNTISQHVGCLRFLVTAFADFSYINCHASFSSSPLFVFVRFVSKMWSPNLTTLKTDIEVYYSVSGKKNKKLTKEKMTKFFVSNKAPFMIINYMYTYLQWASLLTLKGINIIVIINEGIPIHIQMFLALQ